MKTTAPLNEIQKIVNAEHTDPHMILGLHEIGTDKSPAMVLRVFAPSAAKVAVFNLETKKRYELILIHEDGFFERVFKNRKHRFTYELVVTEKSGHEWITRDPYAFSSQITEFDRYLFGQGTHYNIYEKLGAHLKMVDGVNGVAFGVWAPNALRVSVIGDFNSWDGRRHTMRKLSDSGIWELFIPGLCEFDRYKYEIKTFTGAVIEKSDPFAFFNELRPSRASLVFGLDTIERKPHIIEDWKNKPVNIYELHLGSWRKHKGNDRGEAAFLSYTEIADALIPYVKEMGYTHIELLPVMEHPYDGSWGYQVTGYFAVTSRYGNPREFRAFVDRCHENGIGVILDWVPAHFPKDAHGLACFDGTALFEHADPKQGEHPEWGTLIFNYGRSEVKNFLIASALFWIEVYGVDGLRVDAVASMIHLDYAKSSGQWVPNRFGGNENIEAVEFVKHMNSVITGKYPNVMLIAEESTSWPKVSRPVEEGGLGFNLKWNMGWMNDFLSYIKQDSINRKHHHNKLTFGMMYAYSENFVLVLSHDEVVHGKKSLLDRHPGDVWQKCANLRAGFTYLMGHPGKKLVFMGGEFGQFIEWDEKRELDWFLLDYPHHKGIQDYVRDLNHLYLNEKPFWHDDFEGTGFTWLNPDDRNASIISFMRHGADEEDVLLFVINFTPIVHENYRIAVPFEGEFEEILNSDSPKYGGSGVINAGTLETEPVLCCGKPISLTLRVPPLGATILKPVKVVQA